VNVKFKLFIEKNVLNLIELMFTILKYAVLSKKQNNNHVNVQRHNHVNVQRHNKIICFDFFKNFCLFSIFFFKFFIRVECAVANLTVWLSMDCKLSKST